jgi:acetyl esterase/lipase
MAAFPFRGRTVERVRDIPYRRIAGKVIKLDIYRSRRSSSLRPILLYIHGGAWIVGDKREQGLPLMHHLARNGWLCVSANYRLSPGATFPDHLVDAKAALVWIREHAEGYGGDPSFIAVAGGSAGGHLASLVALTAGDPRYQPGFEDADTSVDAAVPLYGVYDLTNRLGVQSEQFVPRLMEPLVMKAFLADEPEKYWDGSPMDRVCPEAPPFLVVQGDKDTLAPAVEARAFVDRLTETSDSRVAYMEFPGAQHVFDLFYSYRCARMIEGATAFLNDERSRHHKVPR